MSIEGKHRTNIPVVIAQIFGCNRSVLISSKQSTISVYARTRPCPPTGACLFPMVSAALLRVLSLIFKSHFMSASIE